MHADGERHRGPTAVAAGSVPLKYRRRGLFPASANVLITASSCASVVSSCRPLPAPKHTPGQRGARTSATATQPPYDGKKRKTNRAQRYSPHSSLITKSGGSIPRCCASNLARTPPSVHVPSSLAILKRCRSSRKRLLIVMSPILRNHNYPVTLVVPTTPPHSVLWADLKTGRPPVTSQHRARRAFSTAKSSQLSPPKTPIHQHYVECKCNQIICCVFTRFGVYWFHVWSARNPKTARQAVPRRSVFRSGLVFRNHLSHSHELSLRNTIATTR